MDRGEHTSEPGRTAVRRLAGKSPRPTNKEMRLWIKDKFGVKISDRMIYAICQRAELPTSSRSTSVINQPRDTQMEASGHWPNLRQTARELSTQLFLPLTQILQFPWSYSLNANLLFIPGKAGVTVGLSIEEEALFISLQEHLPRHRAWVLLSDWKSSAENIARGLNDLCGWVEEQPEVSGRQWLNEEEINRGEVGLTCYFSKSLALDSAEEVCSPQTGSSNWEILGANSQRETYLLNWVRNGSSFVHVAASWERKELEEVKALHQQMSAGVRSLDIIQAICKEGRKSEGIALKLKKELDYITNFAQFTGRCSLCADD